MTEGDRPIAPWWRLWMASWSLVLVVVLFHQPLLGWAADQPALDNALPKIQRWLGGPHNDRATPGFMVNLATDPPLGTVWIDGAERGPSPFFGNAGCRDGEPVLIEVRSQGFTPWSRTVACREGGALEIRARLSRASR